MRGVVPGVREKLRLFDSPSELNGPTTGFELSVLGSTSKCVLVLRSDSNYFEVVRSNSNYFELFASTLG